MQTKSIQWLIGFTIKNFLIFNCLILSSMSFAKIHIEPYAGWSLSFINQKPIDVKQVQGTLDAVNYLNEGRYYLGLTAGMRLGYSSLGLGIGIDMTVGNWESWLKEGFKNFSESETETINPFLPGIFASYKLPLFFRSYASYIPPLSHVILKKDTKTRTCKSPQGFKLGVSYLSLPLVSVNFEYMQLHGFCGSTAYTGTVYVNFLF